MHIALGIFGKIGEMRWRRGNRDKVRREHDEKKREGRIRMKRSKMDKGTNLGIAKGAIKDNEQVCVCVCARARAREREREREKVT